MKETCVSIKLELSLIEVVEQRRTWSDANVPSRRTTGEHSGNSDIRVFLLVFSSINKLIKPDSVAVVRKRTIPTERPPLVGEVSANFFGQRVLGGKRNEFPRPLISVF
jgi:hypothetical protein